MSQLRQRIDELKKMRETVIEADTQMVSRKSFLQLLRYHIELLQEVDSLADSIENNDADGVRKFYERRVNQEPCGD